MSFKKSYLTKNSSWGKFENKSTYKNESQIKPLSAMDLVSKHYENIKIISMSQSIDNILGGGLECGKLTEICGPAGVGKTQICFQACITTQLPAYLGGLNGHAIYIDTEGSFNTKRILEMAKYITNHCKRNLRSWDLTPSQQREVASLTETSFLKSIFYFRCTDQLQLLALSVRLCSFCEARPQIRLVVVDSIAFHFRYDCDDIPRRNRILSVLGQNMARLASIYGLAVVLTNQMTTKFLNGAGFAAPALGESWGHVCPVRIQLELTGLETQLSATNHQCEERQLSSRRRFSLMKHPSRPLDSCLYQITIGGVRDILKKQ